MKTLALLLSLSLISCAHATTVTIHTQDARATLLALKNPSLTHDDAHAVALLHGNQAVLRKLHEFHLTPTTDDFADALYLLAHHQPLTTPNQKSVLLASVQPKADQLLALLHQIEANPATFQRAIEQRIALFTPPKAAIHLEGYVVAAGDGGGYAFGDTDFFLNIGISDDLILSRSITTHELYHAVQGAFASKRELHLPASATACINTGHLFANLYEEGTAVVVADPALITQSNSPIALRMQADNEEGLRHIRESAALLEMSVTSLNAPTPIPYDDMYGVGFLGHGVLYNIAFVMARSINEHDGPQGLITLLQQPPYRFVLRYADLPSYGKDDDHPLLGPNTLAAARLLAAGCH